MFESITNVAPFYTGWEAYQNLFIPVITPLNAEQLDLRPAPHLRSIREALNHIIAVRVRWFHGAMGESCSEEMAAIGQWDRKDQPTRGAAELVEGLQKSFAFVQECLARYTPADLDYIFSETYQGEDYTFSRQWVIWHVIEHDLHHGGEVSLTLGIHQLAAPDV